LENQLHLIEKKNGQKANGIVSQDQWNDEYGKKRRLLSYRRRNESP
jgi:hypothetical protein